MNIDQIALETMREVCAMDDQYLTDQPSQRKARIQIAIRAAIEKALAGNKKLLEESIEREQSLVKMIDKMNSQVTECVFHGHDVERCLQHSGQAPCIIGTELESVSALEKENKALWETLIKIGEELSIDPEQARKKAGKPSEVYIAHIKKRDLIKQAEVLEAAELYAGCKLDTLILNLTASKLRHQALEIK